MTQHAIDHASPRRLDDYARLVAGTHPDPFSVLGPHGCDGQRHITALVPGAEQITAIPQGEVGEQDLAPVPGYAGLFSGPFPCAGVYRLRATDGGGHVWEFEDPYRFGPVIGEMDEYLLGEGTHQRLWQVLGAHVLVHEGVSGTHFAVWAPNARRVSVVGPFNQWDGRRHPMRRRGAT
ncbi:GlgB N-terminal domain-containing protein, partial [Rhodovulum adriaticum]